MPDLTMPDLTMPADCTAGPDEDQMLTPIATDGAGQDPEQLVASAEP